MAIRKAKLIANTVGRLSIALLLLITLGACKDDLYSGLSEVDANTMMAILIKSGIEVEKSVEKDGSRKIRVDSKKLPMAVSILKKHGYPREPYQSMGELFKKEGLISSPLEERVRFIYALSQSVEETLSQIDGVITARVNVVIPKNNPFAEEIKPASASVFIKYRPDSHLEDAKSDIKLIVEKSIEGLDYEKVSVVMLPAQEYLGAGGGKNTSGVTIAGFHIITWLVFFILVVSGGVLIARSFLDRRKPEKKEKDQRSTMPTVVTNDGS